MINIIGAGLAGLSAALTLAESGVSCRLISAQPSERAQSVLAEGGINAALDCMGEGDTWERHFEETMNGGVGLADPNAVRDLARHAPEMIRRLERIGVPFSRSSDGKLLQRSFGGQKKKRTVFAKSSTGKMIMSALIDAVRKYEASGLVTRLPHHTFVRLITDRACCMGVRVRDSFTGEVTDFDGAVIMACGGPCGFFPGMTTGTVTNSGTPAAVMFAQGVKFANLEMIQYHPTTFAVPGKRCLISEAARGEGGRLFYMKDGYPWYFMEVKYPELGDLMPRDVVSREIYLAMRDGYKVFLDMTGIPDDVRNSRLSDLCAEITHYTGLDPAKQPVPVEPGIHYFMGGVYVNERHETSIRGLFAAGECACQYHGANRLGGNSMLGALYGGSVAAVNAAALGDTGSGSGEAVEGDVLCEEVSPAFSARVGKTLSEGLGIVRTMNGIKAAADRINELKVDSVQEKVRKEFARAMLLSALSRMESRGAHFLEELPAPSEACRKTTIAEYVSGTVRISTADIPEMRQNNESHD